MKYAKIKQNMQTNEDVPYFLNSDFTSRRNISKARYICLPLNNWRKDAWVPVVPFTPRNFRSSLARRMALSSIASSWSHRVARLPTVVSWAGWRWVKPNVGTSRYSIANVASLDMQFATLGRSKSNPLRNIIKSLTKKILELHTGRDVKHSSMERMEKFFERSTYD